MWGEGGRLDDTGGQFQSPQVPRYWDGVSPELLRPTGRAGAELEQCPQ